MQQQILHILLEQEEIGWKAILYDLVKSEQMDPWDIDVSQLTKKYIQAIKQMQEHNLRISGKVLLAAAFLLKIKSTHLLENDITQLDNLLRQTEEVDEEFLNDVQENDENKNKEKFILIPRHPQPRNRKVSIGDLMEALQRAMISKRRILAQIKPVKFILPERKIDIVEVIRDVYQKIIYYMNKTSSEKLTFQQLLPPKAAKQDKVYTFIPLLHLEHEQKIEMKQEKPFEEIFVKLNGKLKTG